MPILYVFLARSGKTIRDVSLVTLDDSGALQVANEDGGRNVTRGVRITFAGTDGGEKTLYYFATDLSNNSVRRTGFLKFCETLAPGNSLIKSASYLCRPAISRWCGLSARQQRHDHPGRFRQFRWSNYDPGAWRFFPFGRYAGPIAKFPGKLPVEIRRAFRRSQPIDFRHRLPLALA